MRRRIVRRIRPNVTAHDRSRSLVVARDRSRPDRPIRTNMRSFRRRSAIPFHPHKEPVLEIRHGINLARARALLARERDAFERAMPKSRARSAEAAQHLLFGVPLHWMRDWSTPFSLYVDHARGAHFTDIDGHRYADFCLGDTGARGTRCARPCGLPARRTRIEANRRRQPARRIASAADTPPRAAATSRGSEPAVMPAPRSRRTTIALRGRFARLTASRAAGRRHTGTRLPPSRRAATRRAATRRRHSAGTRTPCVSPPRGRRVWQHRPSRRVPTAAATRESGAGDAARHARIRTIA